MQSHDTRKNFACVCQGACLTPWSAPPDQHHQTPAEWARQALLRSLAAEGVSLRDGAAAVTEPRGDAPRGLHSAAA